MKIISYIKQNKFIFFLTAVIAVLLVLNTVNYTRYQEKLNEVKVVTANLKASQDVIRLTKTKDNKPEYDKFAYLVDEIEDLKSLSYELYQEVNNTKGEVKALQKAGYQIKHDTVPLIVKADINDSSVNLNSKYDTVFSTGNYRSLEVNHNYNFKTHQVSGVVVKDEIGFVATTGLKKTDKGYEIFVQPKYPNMKVVSLEGAVLDKNIFLPPKKKVPIVTLGASIGYTPLTYDFKTKKADLNFNRVGATFGLNFNIVEILKRR